MSRPVLILLALFALATSAYAQQSVSGRVTDTKGKALPAVSLTVKSASGDIISFARSDIKGKYTLETAGTAGSAKIEASSIGYKKMAVPLEPRRTVYDFQLQEAEIDLKTVEVKNRPSLTVNGDTLNYRTSDFAGNQDRSIGDVLKKMPGIEVAENGKISYNGKAISNFYIDGDNVLDDKYNIGTKSIPQGAVEKVQVISNDQPVKMLRKNNMSDDVALNLVLKDEARLKLMGDARLGAGTPGRFDESLTAMLFRKNLKFVNNLKGNNIGSDPGIDLIGHNMGDYQRRVENNKPASLLSAGAAAVPTLPQSRSLYNKAGLINLNNLYKMGTDLQVKANVSYLYDQRFQDYSKVSETYLPGQTISYTEQQGSNMNPQRLSGRFSVLENAEDSYLENTLLAEYAPYTNRASLVMNQQQAGQQLYQHPYEFSNEFSFRKKFRSGRVVNFYSYLSASGQSETLRVSPGLNAGVLNGGLPYAGIEQSLRIPTLFTNNSASFALVKGAFTQTYRAGFQLQKQRLVSDLQLLQHDQQEVAAANAQNDLDWLRHKLYASGIYEYAGEKLKASLTVPLSYNGIDYNDALHDLDKSYQRFLINPSFNLKYNTGIENYVTANYSFGNTLGNLDDVYRGTVLRNYRSLFANNADIPEASTHSANATFSFRKAVQMFFLNVQAGYSDTRLNTISSFLLSNSIQQRIVLPLSNHVRTTNLSANASKYLFALKSTVNAGGSFSSSDYNQLQNSQLLPYTANVYTGKAGFESRIGGIITWSYDLNYTTSFNKAKAENAINTRVQQIRQLSTLALTLRRNVFLNLSGEHILTRQSAQPDLRYIFADASVKYRIPKLKTDLEFGVTNLANVRTFEAIYLSANAYTSGVYNIPGRVAMLRAAFNF
ncbi:carboxypeptidase-like regulatory domain-containing protein [Pedobacter sp. SYP-B3415]|uniref:TonB-dependent receptor n=1 Tax=Pedobacter sp. SYP-B3415 TaxID=2496641 RepID=UPI00101C8EB9|nr:carboxypeptidase-like regulatory domain-containing protein [Pedobacter sp. SYP-B3415]